MLQLDELRLFVHPVVLGSGIRLFDDGSDPVELALTDSLEFVDVRESADKG